MNVLLIRIDLKITIPEALKCSPPAISNFFKMVYDLIRQRFRSNIKYVFMIFNIMMLIFHLRMHSMSFYSTEISVLL